MCVCLFISLCVCVCDKDFVECFVSLGLELAAQGLKFWIYETGYFGTGKQAYEIRIPIFWGAEFGALCFGA